MVRPPHPITARIASAPLLLAAIATLACVNKQELRTARTSVYDTDFAVVYSAVLDAVRRQYPTLDDDPVKGKISTSWHQVQMESPDDQMQAARDPSGLSGSQSQPGLTSGQTRAVRRTFVRFDVAVIGGRPWHVRVVGHASKWEPGDAVPVELRDADEPQWLGGRTDALVVAIYRQLRGSARAAPADSAPVVETPVLDLAVFGPIPAPAAAAAARVRQAVTARDFAALRAATAADVTWSFGAAPGIDGAFITWQGDPDVLDQLAAALDAGCRADGDRRVACPPAAVEQPGYTGWRVVFEPRGKAWAMTAFVQGD